MFSSITQLLTGPCGLGLLLFLFLTIFATGFAQACTLWTAIGSNEQEDKVIFLAKNRDWRPDHRQALRLVRSSKGHDYLGLFAIDGEEPGLKAGINHHGLAIVSASASSIPRQQRKKAPGTEGLMRRLLTSYASVDGIMQDPRFFAQVKPMFLLVTDRHQALAVEIGQNGEYCASLPPGTFSAHTNHFLDPGLKSNNRNIGVSSRQRLATITTLLEQAPRPLTLTQMVAMSEDRSHGPDNSILRTGERPDREQTLATWITALPAHGTPTLYVKLRNPGEKEQTATLHLDRQFWRTGDLQNLAVRHETAAKN